MAQQIYIFNEPGTIDGVVGTWPAGSQVTVDTSTMSVVSVAPIGTPITPVTTSTIPTNTGSLVSINPVSTTSNYVLQAGTQIGQKQTVINISNYPATFLAVGTSNVAAGTSDTIPPLSQKSYTWNGTYWYGSSLLPSESATVVVAASNASPRSQARADFVCTGSADQNTISSAVSTLPAGGGRVLFTEGTYSFSAHYSIVNSNILFQGQGISTVFQCSANDFVFSHSSTAISNISFADMLFIGTVNQTVSVPTQARTTALYFDGSLDAANSTTVITNITVRNCAFRNISSLPIRLFGITGITSVTNCEFTNTKDVGFGFNQEVILANCHSYMSADNGFSISRGNSKITCTGNTAELSCFDGIWLSGFISAGNSTDYGPTDFSCIGNTIKNVGQNGIRLEDAPLYGIVSGNTIDQGYNRGPSDNITDIQCNGIAVRGYPSNAPSSPTFYAKQLLITNNMIRRAPRSGVYLNGCQGVKIANNLIMDIGTQYYADGSTVIGTNLTGMTNPQNVGILIDQAATVTDIYIENNTIIDQRATPYGITAVYPYAPISGVTMINNMQNLLQIGPKLPTIITSEMVGIQTAGEETMPRWAASNLTNITLSSGTFRVAYFRARKNETVTQIRMQSGSTAAGATPTLVQFGLYSVDSSGNLTLLSSISNDTSIFASANTDYTRNMAASVTLAQGQQYAIGAIVVTAATAPTVTGVICSTGSSNSNDPRLTAVWTGQSSLPSSVTAGSLSTSSSFMYAQVL